MPLLAEWKTRNECDDCRNDHVYAVDDLDCPQRFSYARVRRVQPLERPQERHLDHCDNRVVFGTQCPLQLESANPVDLHRVDIFIVVSGAGFE